MKQQASAVSSKFIQ